MFINKIKLKFILKYHLDMSIYAILYLSITLSYNFSRHLKFNT